MRKFSGGDPPWGHVALFAKCLIASVLISAPSARRIARKVTLVTTATIEPHLRQHGQAETEIEVHLRAEEVRGGEGLPRVGFAEVLRLGLTDAEELATVLQYLVRQAESA